MADNSISPRQVIDEMAFIPEFSGSHGTTSSSKASSTTILAANSQQQQSYQQQPYQQQQPQQTHCESDPLLPAADSAAPTDSATTGPTTTIYGGDDQGYYTDGMIPTQKQLHATNFGFRGDVTIRPNTGETNSYEYALFGLALHELLRNLQMANMILSGCSVCMTLLGGIMAWQLLLLGAWSTMALRVLVGLASSLLLTVELLGWHYRNNNNNNPRRSTSTTTSRILSSISSSSSSSSSGKISTFVANLDAILRDNVGLLYHPLGKSLFVALLLGPVSMGIGSMVHVMLGVGYVASGVSLWLAWMLYPEFRKPFDDDNNNNSNTDAASNRQSAKVSSWSYYSGSSWSSGAASK